MTFNCALAIAVMVGQPVTSADQAIESERSARSFLEALASHPLDTRKLVADDAVVVLGDIGGNFSEFLEKARSKATWLDTCQVTSVARKAIPNDAELKREVVPPMLRGGKIELFDGTYSCTGPDGSKIGVSARVAMKNGKVAMLFLNRQR